MKAITAYMTEDGKLFASTELAERHEFMAIRSDIVNQFLDSQSNNYKGTPQRAIAKNTVLNWELWKVRNDIK
jgi:hypothetical protein